MLPTLASNLLLHIILSPRIYFFKDIFQSRYSVSLLNRGRRWEEHDFMCLTEDQLASVGESYR